MTQFICAHRGVQMGFKLGVRKKLIHAAQRWSSFLLDEPGRQLQEGNSFVSREFFERLSEFIS